MAEAKARPVIFEGAAAHPEEIRSEFELRVGRYVTLQGKARITPAGLVCSGLAVALMGFGLGYLARSTVRRAR